MTGPVSFLLLAIKEGEPIMLDPGEEVLSIDYDDGWFYAIVMRPLRPWRKIERPEVDDG